MLNKIQEQIELSIYGYDPNDFLPVREGDELLNRGAFVAYKAKRALGHFGITHDNMMSLGNKIDGMFTANSIFN